MAVTTAAGALARELANAGTTHFFGVMGDDTMGVTAGLVAAGATYHPARHEAAAVGMADGYSWATEAVGLCVVTRGPGLVNGLAALRTAARAGRKVLVVCGDVPGGAPRAIDFKHVDLEPLAAAIGFDLFRAGQSRDVPVVTREALAAAGASRTSVLAVPDDVLNGPAADATRLEPTVLPADPPSRAEPADSDVAAVTNLVSRSHRPLVLVGRGTADASTAPLLSALAERLGARIGTTLLAKDVFRGNPRNLGVVGGFASDPAIPELAGVDLVLAFGASLNPFTTAERTLFRQAAVVQVDVEPTAIGRYFEVDVGIPASAEATARRLLEAVPSRSEPSSGVDDKALAEITTPWYRGSDESTADALDPRVAAQEIGDLLPEQRTLILDSGRFMSWPGRFIPTTGPDRFRLTADFGQIGAGLGVALGASVARPDETTALFIGDGALSNLLGDLETAAYSGRPLVVVVMNDDAYGAELWHASRHALPGEIAHLRPIDFAGVARSLGMEAVAVRTLAELRAVADRLASPDRPFLIDCKIRRDLDLERFVTWPDESASSTAGDLG